MSLYCTYVFLCIDVNQIITIELITIQFASCPYHQNIQFALEHTFCTWNVPNVNPNKQNVIIFIKFRHLHMMSMKHMKHTKTSKWCELKTDITHHVFMFSIFYVLPFLFLFIFIFFSFSFFLTFIDMLTDTKNFQRNLIEKFPHVNLTNCFSL